MSFFQISVVLLFASVTGGASPFGATAPSQLTELAPTGKLRVGVVSAPAKSALFVVKDADGQPQGVTVDLGEELAHDLGVPVEFHIASNTGELVDALSTGSLDVAFMPVDDERKKRVNFGPAYFIIESTYLVRPNSDINSLNDVDRPNVRVIGIANTATIRGAGRSLKKTTVTAVQSVDEAMQRLRTGAADAFALTHDALPSLATQLPGSRILDGSFLQTGVAIAVPRNRPNALAYSSAFMENAKRSGIVRRAFDNAGLKDLSVAPPVGSVVGQPNSL